MVPYNLFPRFRAHHKIFRPRRNVGGRNTRRIDTMPPSPNHCGCTALNFQTTQIHNTHCSGFKLQALNALQAGGSLQAACTEGPTGKHMDRATPASRVWLDDVASRSPAVEGYYACALTTKTVLCYFQIFRAAALRKQCSVYDFQPSALLSSSCSSSRGRSRISTLCCIAYLACEDNPRCDAPPSHDGFHNYSSSTAVPSAVLTTKNLQNRRILLPNVGSRRTHYYCCYTSI